MRHLFNRPLWRQLGWMVFIWAASVSALLALSFIMRALMNTAGMQT